ncbi:branched-chain amino acid ABC transporter permease [Fodinicurvata sediminis]|uniref:branched-chain amino acid ABC transporter permease n=1 Tax=Fodinicurvata sediminis TaxID=1121832 RepID=UPI0003B67160|nr:branched-chain amino acid ABC transporter permease [Fodinicurvata sediminis]
MMDILVFGATRGSVYALVAVGFVLVFSVGGILNLAHGALFMLGAYFTFIIFSQLFSEAGTFSLIISMILATACVSIFSLFVYRFIYLRAINSISYIMVISLAISLFVSEIMALLYGVTGTSVSPIIGGNQNLLGARILNQELIILAVSFVVLSALWYFLHSTRWGKAITAVAQNSEGARLIGIDSKTILAITIVLSAALAGLAGTLVSSLITVVPGMWEFWLVKAFAIAIVGGLGSIPGAIVASFVVSFAEVIAFSLSNEQYSDLVALIIIVTILVFRPQGIMGTRKI